MVNFYLSGPHQRQTVQVSGVAGRASLLSHTPMPLLTRQSLAGQPGSSVFNGPTLATHGEMVTLVVGVRFPEGLKYTG
jgi:hypothetical protein